MIGGGCLHRYNGVVVLHRYNQGRLQALRMANVMSLLRPLLLDNVPSIQQSVREPFISLNP